LIVEKQALRWVGVGLVLGVGMFGFEACGGGDSTANDAGNDVTVTTDASNDDVTVSDSSASDATSDVMDASADVDPYADADPNCADYTDAAANAAVYLGYTQPTCKFYLGFDLVDQNNVKQKPNRESYESTCKELQSDCQPAPTCEPPVVTKLAPGKTFDIGWPGTVFDSRLMPPKCYYDAGCNTGSCLQEVAAPSGTISTTAYTSFACPDSGTCFDCTTGFGGSCIVTGAIGAAGTALPTSAAYTSGQGSVTLHVQ
jgi:hypothetical protein